MLSAQKERWRKKRSIIEAKRRREEDAESDEEDVKGNGAGLSSPTTSSSDVRQPRLFIDGTLGGGGHSQAILQQLSAGDVLIGCDVDPAALATASTRLMEYFGTCDYILDKNDNDPDEQPNVHSSTIQLQESSCCSVQSSTSYYRKIAFGRSRAHYC